MNLALFAAAAAAAATLTAPDGKDRAACTDRITQVRAATGQPLLQRGAAKTGEPLLIAAVDKRVDGCRVLVMAADSSDIRPEPEVAPNQVLLRPAR